MLTKSIFQPKQPQIQIQGVDQDEQQQQPSKLQLNYEQDDIDKIKAKNQQDDYSNSYYYQQKKIEEQLLKEQQEQQKKQKKKRKYQLARKMQQEYIQQNTDSKNNSDIEEEDENIFNTNNEMGFTPRNLQKSQQQKNFLLLPGQKDESQQQQNNNCMQVSHKKHTRVKLMNFNHHIADEIKEKNIFSSLKAEKYKRMQQGPIENEDGEVVPYSLVGKPQSYLTSKEKDQRQQKINQFQKENQGQKGPQFRKRLTVLCQSGDMLSDSQNNSKKNEQESNNNNSVQALSSFMHHKKKPQNKVIPQTNKSSMGGLQTLKIDQKTPSNHFNSSGIMGKNYVDPNKFEFMNKEELIEFGQKLDEKRQILEQEEHFYYDALPLEVRNEYTRQERVLQKHEQQEHYWEQQQNILNQKIDRTQKSMSLMQSDEQFRKKKEITEAIESMKPLDVKVGSRLWYMSLRSPDNAKINNYKQIKKQNKIIFDQPDEDPTVVKNIKDIQSGFDSLYHVDNQKQVQIIRHPKTSQNSRQNSQNLSQSLKKSSDLKSKVLETREYFYKKPDSSYHDRQNSLPLFQLNGLIPIQYDENEDIVIQGKNKLQLEINEIKNDGRAVESIYKKEKNNNDVLVKKITALKLEQCELLSTFSQSHFNSTVKSARNLQNDNIQSDQKKGFKSQNISMNKNININLQQKNDNNTLNISQNQKYNNNKTISHSKTHSNWKTMHNSINVQGVINQEKSKNNNEIIQKFKINKPLRIKSPQKGQQISKSLFNSPRLQSEKSTAFENIQSEQMNLTALNTYNFQSTFQSNNSSNKKINQTLKSNLSQNTFYSTQGENLNHNIFKIASEKYKKQQQILKNYSIRNKKINVTGETIDENYDKNYKKYKNIENQKEQYLKFKLPVDDDKNEGDTQKS